MYIYNDNTNQLDKEMKSGYSKKIINANKNGKRINVLYPKKLNIVYPETMIIEPKAKLWIPINYLEEKANMYVDEYISLYDEIQQEYSEEFSDEEELNELLREIDMIRQY